MILIFFILVVVIIIGPVGSMARFAVWFARPKTYIYNQARARSVVHDVCVMIVTPSLGLDIALSGYKATYGYGSWLIEALVGYIVLVVAVYFLFIFYRKLLPPYLELAGNLVLGGGIGFNIFSLWDHFPYNFVGWIWLLGNLPVILLLGLMIARRYRLLIQRAPETMEHSVPYDEILDYLPEQDEIEPYYIERRGITALLLLEMPLRLLLFVLIGTGLGAVFLEALKALNSLG